MRAQVGPLDIETLPWEPLGDHGLRRRVLSEDPDTGAVTEYVHIPATWKGGGVAHYHSCYEEAYIIEGDVTLNGRDYLVGGSYLYRPGNIVHGHNEGAKQGCMCVIRMGAKMDFNLVHEPTSEDEYPLEEITDPKGHVLHLQSNDMDWTEQGDEGNRYRFKLLSFDPGTRSYCALMKLDKGWSGRLSTGSEFGREWLMLSGAWTREDGATFGSGTYYYAPPGTEHAAVTGSEEGCVVLTWMHAPD